MLTTTNMINILIYMQSLGNLNDLNNTDNNICSSFKGGDNTNIYIIYG